MISVRREYGNSNRVPISARRFKKRLNRKRPPTNRTLNKKIKKIQNMQELKHFDTLVNADSIIKGGTLVLLNGIGIGDTNITRDGSFISSTSVQMRITLRNLTTTDQAPVVRIIVFWDEQANGDPPTISGNPNAVPPVPALLDDSVITSGTLGAVYMPYQHEQSKRFKILHDRIYPVYLQAGADIADTGNIQQTVPIKLKIPLGRNVKYMGADTDIDSISTNSLYLFYSSPSNSQALISAGIRFYFKDS